jgi:hypothetical protein
MRKNIEEDVVRSEIQDGLSQVDENLLLDEVVNDFDKETRKLTTYFKATNAETNEIIETSMNWG